MNRESEYLAAIIENAGSLIVVLDCHGRIQRFNRACERATGYMFEEVRGQPFFDLFLISEEIGPVKEVFERLLAKDFPNHFENHWKTKAGRVRMISWNNTALLDGQGDVEHIVSIGIDVTEQRAAEKALRENEELYRSLFYHHHTPRLLIDPDTGRIVDANPAACAFYEYIPDELKLKYISDINMLPREQVIAKMQQALSEACNHFFFQHRIASGEVRDVEVFSSPVQINGKLFLFSIIHDITGRKRIEERARSLARFPDENPSPVMRIGLDGVIRYANRASEPILNSWDRRINEMVPLDWQEAIEAVCAAGAYQEVEAECDGRVFSCLLVPFTQDGYVNLYGRDITERVEAEEESARLLRELEAERSRWQTTVESMLDPVTVSDNQGRAIYMNAAYSQMLDMQIKPELDVEEHAGYYRIYHPDGALFDPHDLPLQKAALTGQNVRNVELVQIAAAGEKFHMIWNASPLYDAKGRVSGAVSIGHDITDRKHREEEREAYLSRLNTLLEVSKKVISAQSLQGMLQQTVDAARQLTGARLEYQGSLSNPLFALAEEQGEDFTQEDKTLLAQLTTIASLSLQHIEARDNAERRADELDVIINAMAEAVVIYDAQGRLLRVNPSAVAAFGYNPLGEERLELVQKISIQHLDGRPVLVEELPSTLALNGQGTKGQKFLFYNTQGEERTALCSGSPLYLRDQLVGAVVVFHDVTELELAQAALKSYAAQLENKNRELQDFAFISSHDLQEPLRKIQAFSERLDKKYSLVLDQEGREYLMRMNRSAARMQRMLNDLLAYSRVTTKARSFIPVDLNEVIVQVLQELDFRIEQSGARVEVGPAFSVEADPLQMYQLLQNLIANALKFHQSGSPPVIQITSQFMPELPVSRHTYVELSVEDNGIGFDERHLERIFQPFQRLHGIQEFEGSGMGLAICRKIVERHGGNITARSSPGQGAVFIVTLPARQA